MKSLLHHAFGVKGFRCLRTRYEGGKMILLIRFGLVRLTSSLYCRLCLKLRTAMDNDVSPFA
jgi:hypothetical protein